MKEAFAGSDYAQLREQIDLLRKEIEELKADRSSKPSSARWRRFAGRHSWAWLRITTIVLLALSLLGAQNKPDALFIDSKGYVGINKTNPEAPLDVNGDALFRGQLSVGKNLQVSGDEQISGRLQARGVIPGIPPLEQAITPNSGVVIGNSDIYFTNTQHSHTGQGNQQGFAAIENAQNYGALMILGRTVPNVARIIGMWDRVGIAKGDPETALDVNGNAIVRSDLTVRGNSSISGNSSVSANLTIGGRVDLGIYQKQSTSCGNGTCDIACDGDDVAISGGGWVGRPSMLRESRPLPQKTWRVACAAVRGLGIVEDSKCDQAWVVCARHAK